MEDTHLVDAAGEPRASGPVTAAIGIAVATAGIAVAFNATDVSSHWFALFKLIHVVIAAFWVGGGLMITILALRAERSGKPDELASIARQAAFVGEKPFAPGLRHTV